MRVLFIIACVILFTSCNTTKYVTLSKELSKSEALEDVEYIKSKLSSAHVDINWEGREDIILDQLDQAALACDPCDVKSFEKLLLPIFNTIDDGHSQVFGLNENNLKNDNHSSIFASTLLDDQSLYLKIPNFVNDRKLRDGLNNFRKLLHSGDVTRVVIDLRDNQGGSIANVENFLSHTLTENRDLCQEIRKKRRNSFFKSLLDWKYYFKKGYRKSDEYHINNCRKIYTEKVISNEMRYLLVNNSIMSGGTLASYHLEKDGYIVIGTSPKGICNTFGLPISYNLPNSNLYINLSSLRIHVNDNIGNRNDDKIIPDMELPDYSMVELLEILKERERNTYSKN